MLYIIASGKKATKHGKNTLETVIKKLNEKKVDFKVLKSEHAGHAIDLAKEATSQDDCTGVVALGGDGTLFEVLNGMDTKKCPIGFIPAGTGNDFARCLNFTPNIDESIDNILNNKPIYLDYLKVGDKYKAFNVVGTGFDIQLLEKEAEIRDKFDDRSSYFRALLYTILFCKFETIKFKLDDQEEQTREIFMMDCCNGKWGAGMMPLCLEADPHDGVMDFVIIKKFFKPRILTLLLKFQKGLLPSTNLVEHFTCKKVSIDIEPKLKANLDGELLDLFPLTVELIHNELRYFPSSNKGIDPLKLLNDKKLKKQSL